jgi:hypothetical protein
MRKIFFVVMLVALLAQVASAEEPKKSDEPVRTTTTNTPYSRGYAPATGEYGEMGGYGWYGMESDTRGTKQLVDRWKAAREASERDKIEKSLHESLTTEFTQRLAAHEREIKQLEEKVRQLRDRLSLRREKQDEIVEHRLQQILREAQGLGWGSEEVGNFGGYGRASSMFRGRGYGTSAPATTQTAPSAFAPTTNATEPAAGDDGDSALESLEGASRN